MTKEVASASFSTLIGLRFAIFSLINFIYFILSKLLKQ